MRNRWSETEAAEFEGPLGECVYGSRLLGADMALVMHGGGNTSVKVTETDVFGDPVEVLRVKGSGWNLATIEPEGFAPLHLERTRALVGLAELSDTAMVRELRSNLTDPAAPNPSVEAILHAVIPEPAVQHSHADAIVSVTNTVDGETRIREIYGDRMVVVPYVMPGFDLARACAEAMADQRGPQTVGMILMNHGIFTWGATTREAYDRMIGLVTEAEEYLARHASAGSPPPPAAGPPDVDPGEISALRAELSAVAARPMILTRRTDERSWSFVNDSRLERISQQGPATPDHVLWTKRVPMLGRDVNSWALEYEEYFERNRGGRELTRLDAAPRVILDPELGMVTVGVDASASDRVADIYGHTIDVVWAGEGMGGYRALPESDIFDVEYWELEQAKLSRAGGRREFTGEVALVTGAASGIGRACAETLLARGAAVVGVDVSPGVVEVSPAPAFVGVVADLTSASDTAVAVRTAVERFGGIDMVVAAAGIFPESAPISAHDPQAWRKAMAVNVDALVQLLAVVHPHLAVAPLGGRVTVIGSKNVAAPGPGASAYSASKAAANQIARVAALEWAGDGIRVNSVHPDAVFDTGLWSPELIAERAARYEMTVEEYKKRNLLGAEINSSLVADLVATTLGASFAATTGAHIPIDGGSDRII
ncbi:MAG TPA: bifunctional aldolase/short-chain dehydrogenase [Acidimicrobiales bacterium]|nr:bifunctional aldolase/short-chain dehydrogenase [Acidimicrobiales bacterium]